jgi:hypothetical protein
MFSRDVACWAIDQVSHQGARHAVGLRKAVIETAELDPNVKVVHLFSLGGLTVSRAGWILNKLRNNQTG